MAAVPPPLRWPYGRQLIEADDVAAVVEALTSDHIAHGPQVEAFEREFAAACGAREAVAVSSGTAALHLALLAAGIGPGQTCAVPAVTFLSTATAVLMCGAAPRLTDVDPDTGLMTPETLRAAATEAELSAVLPVHLGGRICDLAALEEVAPNARIIEDACHAVGGVDADGRRVGACARAFAATFSFHPVKTLTSGEGGMIALNDAEAAARLRRLRNHGVTREADRMGPDWSEPDGRPSPWAYAQLEVGWNYRMNELEAALGRSQLRKLPRFAERRRRLCRLYDAGIAALGPIVRPASGGVGDPVRHLYPVLIDFEAAGRRRAEVMRELAEAGVGTQVHYIPLNRQPALRRLAGRPTPGAEAYYGRVLALPLYPALADEDVAPILERLARALRL